MADSVDRVFVHALNTVKRLPRTGSARPPDADRLKLYGLYKQSTEGDVEGAMGKPDDKESAEGDGISELEKWESWKANTGVLRTEAKRLYITTLIETMHRYATTTSESRELVAELEFVWNQIKSNPVSSVSSPGQLPISRAAQQSPLARYSTRGSQLVSRDGLRLLRPLSDNAEDDALNSDIEFDDAPVYGERGVVGESAGSKGLEDQKRTKTAVEKALARMTVEIAALREQLEAHDFGTYQLRNRASAWAGSVILAVLRHILIDVTLLAFVLLWARRSRDPVIAQGYRLLFSWLKQKLRILRFSTNSKEITS